jgi:hypothetical protein
MLHVNESAQRKVALRYKDVQSRFHTRQKGASLQGIAKALPNMLCRIGQQIDMSRCLMLERVVWVGARAGERGSPDLFIARIVYSCMFNWCNV